MQSTVTNKSFTVRIFEMYFEFQQEFYFYFFPF